MQKSKHEPIDLTNVLYNLSTHPKSEFKESKFRATLCIQITWFTSKISSSFQDMVFSHFGKNTWLETYISWSIFVLYNTLQCNIKAALVQKRKPFKNHGNKIEHPLSLSCNFVEACFQFHTCTCINYIL